MKLSSEVEVKADEIVWPDGEKEVTYYIRKKPLSLTKKYVSLFGFNVETIYGLAKLYGMPCLGLSVTSR